MPDVAPGVIACFKKGFEIVAFDASKEMCIRSSMLLGQEVLNKSFDEINYFEEFEGIWACASLLHVNRRSIVSTIQKLVEALKPRGVLYMSFKHGDRE